MALREAEEQVERLKAHEAKAKAKPQASTKADKF